MHQTVAIEQRKMLAHTNRADTKRLAEFSRCHVALPSQQGQDLFPRFTLFAVLQWHARFLSILMPNILLLP
jgi:hypothetical protein